MVNPFTTSTWSLSVTSIILVQGLNAHPYYTWVSRPASLTGTPRSESRLQWHNRLSGAFRSSSRREAKHTLQEEVFWPLDLLPQKLKQPSRIATYSYVSNWRAYGIKTDLRECGEQLLIVLGQHRRDEASNDRYVERSRAKGDKAQRRPIVLIGHSLGGLVIKQVRSIS